jgi:hypothetical protein
MSTAARELEELRRIREQQRLEAEAEAKVEEEKVTLCLKLLSLSD